MSITSARNFMEKSGCGLIVGIGLAVVIGMSLMNAGTCQNQQTSETPEQAIPIAKIKDVVVALNVVEQRYDQAAAQTLNVEGGPPPERAAEIYASALDIELRMVAQREIARQKGIQITSQRILDQAAKQFDEQIAQQRGILTQLGQIKPNATEAEIQAALSTAFGVKDIAQARADLLKQVETNLQKPSTRQQMEAEATGPLLIEAFAGEIKLSDEELKKDLEKFVTKRVAFYPFEHPDVDLAAKAEKVLAEIKGGLSFEAAMDKYSDDPAPADKKKKSESTVDLTRAVMSYDDSYKPLLELKPGDVSPVIQLNTGPAIFKIIRVDTKLPDNFESTKEDLRKNRVREIAVKKIQSDIESMLKSDDLKWQSDGFRVLHSWLKALRDPELLKDEAAQNSKMAEIADEAEKVLEAGDPIGNRAAQLAFYSALDKVFDASAGEKKKEMQERWVKAATAVLESTENVALRIEIAELQLSENMAKPAAEALLVAAQANSGYGEGALANYKKIETIRTKVVAAGVDADLRKQLEDAQNQWKSDAAAELQGQAEFNEDYSESGRTAYADVGKKLATYRAQGIVTAEQAKAVEAELARWRREKIKADEEMAKEAQRQKDELKKAEEEAKKAVGESKPAETKTGDTKLPSSSDLPNPTKSGG